MGIELKHWKARAKDYWGALDESQRATRRVLIALLGLALLAVPGWWLGWPRWQEWQRRTALEQAGTFAEASDYRSASLALRRAIELGPADPGTWREAVRLLGEIGSPEVLAAHENLERLAPGDPAVKVAWVTDALRFERWEVAREQLAELDEMGRRDAAFFRLAAALARALGRAEELERNLEQLVAAAPEDLTARFNLAAVRLWDLDPAKQSSAREELRRLTEAKGVRVRAALELLKAAARERNEERVRETIAWLQEKFVPRWRADFADGGTAGMMRLIEHLKAAAEEEGAASVALLARWLGDLGQRREALIWLEGLPAEAASSAEAKEVAAELSAELGDLDRLEHYLRAGAWGIWPRDVLTLAMASRLQQLRHGEAQARATWENAVAAAGDSLPALRALVRLANSWGQPQAAEQALQAIVQQAPKSFWAYEALRNMHAASGDVSRLWQVYAQWVRHEPDSPGVVASWVVLGCILDRQDAGMAERAETLQARADAGPDAVVALAAVRWRQKRPRETVALLEKLAPELREQAQVSLWRGLAEADLGNKAAAEKSLARALGGRLSAEEAKLAREAAQRARISLPGTL